MHKNIKILLTCSILLHGGINLLAPIYALFIKNIGGTLLDASATIGCYAILRGVFYFLLRRLDERHFSKKFMISFGYFLFFVSYIGYLFVTKAVQVFFIQGLLAFAEVVINPSWSAVIAKSLTKGKERDIYSNFYGYRSFFEGLGAIAGGLFVLSFGYNTLFTFMTLLALSASILSLLIKENAENIT